MMNGHHHPYIQAAIDGEVARLASAQPGERNNTLFRSAAALASFQLREGEIIAHLKPLADSIGLRGSEFYSTVKSAVKTGQANPRPVPVNEASFPARTTTVERFPAQSRSGAGKVAPAFLRVGTE